MTDSSYQYRYVWPPYTQELITPPPLQAVKTNGCLIELEDGRQLVDGIASWWSVCHGYNHPHIIQEMQKQLALMPHVMFGGITHEPAERLAERLMKIAPPGLNKVFLTDSGSVAVEAALKMAVQYWKNLGHSRRDRFICFRGGYHGDTMGCMSVSEPGGLHKAYRGYMPMQLVLDIPTDEYSFQEFEETIEGIALEAAGAIIEPLAQCAGGFKFHSADVLAEIYRIIKKHNLLFIADEAATGFYRTGSMFACLEAGITPDIMILGKALTGGYITLAATLATDTVYQAFLSDDPAKALMHGPTFTANPLACSAANASLDLFEREPRAKQAEQLERIFSARLPDFRQHPGVKNVRYKGAIGVVEYDEAKINTLQLRAKLIEHGAWLRPFGGCLYLMPPFTISDNELEILFTAMDKALDFFRNSLR